MRPHVARSGLICALHGDSAKHLAGRAERVFALLPSDEWHPRSGPLRGIANWAVACLRRQRLHAKRPESPALSGQRPPLPARAMSAQVKLANPVYPVRRADRGPAPITRLIHPPPPAGPLPGPGAWPAALYGFLTTSHLLPGPAAIAAIGTTARSRAGSHGAGHRHRAWAATRSDGRLSRSGAGRTTRAPAASPHQYRAAAPPARYRPGPDARPASKDGRNHFQAHADGQD